MFEQIIYFFRQKSYFFYSGLLVFSILYGYVLGLYFLDWTKLEEDIFLILLFLSLIWVIVFFISYKGSSKKFHLEREKEKFYIFQEKISDRFGLNSQNNIFKKISFIREFVKNNYNEKGLFSIKILILINKTLYLYIENLTIIDNLNKNLKLTNNLSKCEEIEKEIKKNNEQNESILNYLDEYIHELTNKNINDEKVSSLKSELEYTMQILKDISPRKKELYEK